MQSLKKFAPTCLAMNSVGLRCGLDALPDSDRCQLHQDINQSDDEDFSSSFLSAQDFAQNVLQSWEFREYIIKGLQSCKIAPAIILRFMDYADNWGKPAERVEHTDKNGKSIVTEIRRTIIHPSDESEPETTVEMQDEGLDVPMIPSQIRRMH